MSRREPEVDDAPSVDFVVGDASVDDRDEDLPAPSGSPVLRRVVVLALAAVVGGVLVARVATTHPAQPAAKAAASSAPSSTPGVTGPTRRLDLPPRIAIERVVSLPPAVTIDVRTGMILNCPELLACSISRTVPSAVSAALRASFPTIRVRTVSTVLGLRDNSPDHYVLARTVVAQAGSTSLVVRVRQSTEVDDTEGGSSNGRVTATSYYDALVPGYAVSVTAGRPRRAGPVALVTLATLANRPGLLAQ